VREGNGPSQQRDNHGRGDEVPRSGRPGVIAVEPHRRPRLKQRHLRVIGSATFTLKE
jgi:hypothetical protein